DQEVQDAGGYMNAYTSFDRTVYWINVPNTGATVAIDILCDVVQNATLPADELAKEKQVILREMDMNQDDPGQRSARRLFETAYTKSPYRYTVIGYPDIYNEVQREDIFAYYHEKYAPNNLFIIIIGDIKAREVEAQVRSAFASARDAMLAEVERMKTELVTTEEMTKAVKQFTASTLASRKTVQGQAQDLGSSWMAANDLNFSARYLEAIKRATPADLQRVARE